MPNSPTSTDAPWEYTLYIPHDPRAVTVSRRTLRLILTLHGLLPLSETAELVATELVSNAVRHTKGPAALRLRWAGRVLRIGVWDADPTPPAPPLSASASAEAENGRGLDLVRNCTDGWGWYQLSSNGNSGKFVWCELASIGA
ncbi:ATP-binding protein [Streptomyces sp. NBC_01242]|uniref:ATP-binding protein n=1 Tax=Streptomyces sp. NBC_01242 TaxID=2903795 RepID=UPI0022523A07|nr:ATP-binding protein [Streptomyces sp. NBC_01242]MCX4796374.1 ATP-binding protein [Streptomyces sp. NBC_01242]